MTATWSELHTFIIYVLSGYTLIFLMLPLFFKFFRMGRPLQRLQLYLIAFLTPPAGFVLYHTVLTKRCQSGHGGSALHFFCDLSGNLLYFLLPFLGIALALGLLKGITGSLLLARLERQRVAPDGRFSEQVDRILARHCASLSIRVPRVIYCSLDGFAAFTAGLSRQALVLNANLVASLGEQDLETLLAHELIHIRRKDTLKSYLLHLIRDITFFNPLSGVILKRCLLEKELLCDREAAELIGQTPKTYAASLLRVWRALLEQRPLRFGPVSAFNGGGGSLEQRVKALLRPDPREKQLFFPGTALPPAVLFLTVLIFLGMIC